MQHPISNEARTSVIELWLRGEPYTIISAQTGVSTGKISDIISKEFLPALGDRLIAEYLRQLVVEVKAAEITIKQCAIGLRTSRLLQRLGIRTADSMEKLQSFLDEVYSAYTRLASSTGPGMSPATVIELAGQLLEISQKNDNITPAEIPKYVEGKIEEKRQLDNEIELLKQKHKNTENHLKEQLVKQQVSSANLEQYVFLREELEKQGLKSSEIIEKFVNAIKNADKMQYNVTKIVKEISELEFLEDRKTKLEHEKKQLDKEIRKLSGNRDSLQRTLDTFSLTVDKIKELDSRGFTLAELQKLSHIIYEIANTRSETSSYTTQEAVSKFFKDVEEQYSKVLSFEEKLKHLQENIDEKASELKTLEITYAHEKTVIDGLKALLAKNVTEKDILNWTHILKRYDNELPQFNIEALASDLEKYGSMKETLAKLNEQIEKQDNEMNALVESILDLEEEKTTLEMQIDEVLSKLKESADIAKSTVALTTDESLKNISKVTEGIKQSLELNRELLGESHKISRDSIGIVARLGEEVNKQMISIAKLEGFKDLAEVVRLIALIKPKEGEPLKVDPELLNQLQMHLIRVIDLIESIYKMFGPDASKLIAGLIELKQAMMLEISNRVAFGVMQSQVSQQQNPSSQSKESTVKGERSDSSQH